MVNKMKIFTVAACILVFSQHPAIADYRTCEWNGAAYSHGAKNPLGQTCEDGVWRG